MKIYYDNLEPYSSNLDQLSESKGNTFWISAKGTVIKKTLIEMGYNYHELSMIDEPGCYFVDVNGDPNWWCGVLTETGVPRSHIIDLLPKHIVKLTRNKKLRIIIAADREGGSMQFGNKDCFETTHQAMINQNLPSGSVLIIQGNKKIEEQYQQWLLINKKEKLFEVQYSCHFDKIFFDDKPIENPIITKSLYNAKFDFNSLNRVYRSHRGAHCYYLAKNNLLDSGLVSCNDIPKNDLQAANWNSVSEKDFMSLITEVYPRYIDGNWKDVNAANQYNLEIYEKSLISFITETKFDENVVFLTEKIFKPIALGHPLICLASAGTLRGLAELGFRIDWYGIDPSYNDIEDHKERFLATHKVLEDWITLSRDKKINKILDSIETINHNFKLIRERHYYRESLERALNSSREYFND
jgi:hypothetical protein